MTAAASTSEKRSGTAATWLLVELAGDRFALPVAAVQEVLGLVGVSRVKDPPFPVRGTVNLRGVSVPVVDLRMRMGLGKTDVLDSRLVVVVSRGHRIGLLVDKAERLVQVPVDRIATLPSTARTAASGYLQGVFEDGEELILLLDLDKTLRFEGEV